LVIPNGEERVYGKKKKGGSHPVKKRRGGSAGKGIGKREYHVYHGTPKKKKISWNNRD